MVCPYCSTDMEPIELNGKVFCSNCGLTIANNAPQPVANTINPAPDAVNDVATEKPEEVPFETMPAPEAVPEQPMIENSEEMTSEPETVARKLEVVTEEPTAMPVSFSPITEEAEKDLGIAQAEPALEPVFESKISDLSIPSEEDFSKETPPEDETASSYVELANPGDEKSTLEASGILLDILGEEKKPAQAPEAEPLDVVKEPEIPAKTVTAEKDDIYTLPSEVKVGLRNKKVKKEETTKPMTVEEVDPKTEKRIEKLEEKIAKIPEPAIALTPTEATQYDPDTIQKSKVIKDYFSTAIEKDKTAHKAKNKKQKRKQAGKLAGIFTLVLLVLGLLGVAGFYAYNYYQPENTIEQAKESATFTTLLPSYIPEGYALTTSDYADLTKSFEATYVFANDETKSITYKQVETNNTDKYVSDYLLSTSASFIEKEVAGVTFTEANTANLLWENENFVFVLETQNFTLSNELLYKMAESVGK